MQFIREATRAGKRSIAVVIPSKIVKSMGIRERQKLTPRQRGDKIIIEDYKNK